MTIKLPEKTHVLGGPLPPIPQRVVSWPWGGTPHLTQWSIDQLKHPLGTLIYEVVDGHPVLAQIQTHYSYGAHPDWPDKAHKGTSVFVPVGTDPATGKAVALHDPPEGWGQDEATASMGFDWTAYAIGFGAASLYSNVRTAAEWVRDQQSRARRAEFHKKPPADAASLHGETDPFGFDFGTFWWGAGTAMAVDVGASAVRAFRDHMPETGIHGEMYSKRRGGGYRFSSEPDFEEPGYVPLRCEPFAVRRHGMMY